MHKYNKKKREEYSRFFYVFSETCNAIFRLFSAFVRPSRPNAPGVYQIKSYEGKTAATGVLHQVRGLLRLNG